MEDDYSQKKKLNKLENKLYSRNAPEIIDPGRSSFKEKSLEDVEKEGSVGGGWEDLKKNSFDEIASKMSRVAETKHNFLKKIFGVSLAFFVIAAGVAAYVFFGGVNSVSSKNVDIKVVGPIAVGGGQEVSFDVNVINNNNVDLESATLFLEYPEGTKSPADLSMELDREKFDVGVVESGESVDQNVKLVFFGEKDTLKNIKISLEYRVKNSSALFYKEKEHEVVISSAPVIITPTYPKEVNSNQEIVFDIEVASNSKDKIQDFLVNVDYPFGFVFKEASPGASFNNNIWKFSNFNPGEKKRIRITGNIIGQDNEERVFRINAGTPSADDERVIAVSFTELTESVLVQKPFIGLDVLVNGQDENAVAQGGSQVVTDINLQNNLPSRLFNTSVSVSFKGGAFNGLSVSPSNNGFFESLTNTITWDKRSVSSLGDINPGASERLSFRVSPLPYSNIPKGSKPEVEMTVKITGERVLESGSVEQVSATETRKIVLSTDLSLTSKTLRSSGNLENSGPIPPKVNIPTTYNILWSVENSFNQVGNVEVRAILPSYVKWTNLKSPESEIFSFDDNTKEVVWRVGTILPNTGSGNGKKEIYFQLEFLPSSSQLGDSPTILGEAKLTGTDKVTGQKVSVSAFSVTTNFSGDPTFQNGFERVVP